jgi:hypothetical protein
MPWTQGRWPVQAGDPIEADGVMNEVRGALAERNGLVPAGRVPPVFSQSQALRGTPAGGSPIVASTVANFQYQVQGMLTLAWPLRWWDASRDDLYTLPHLCRDAFDADDWSVDLAAADGQGDPLNRWTPATARLFDELYAAINRLDRVRILPTFSESRTSDSVYRLQFGIGDWPEDRAETFSLFDGEDDGQAVGLDFDVGLGGEVSDAGSTAQWTLESRRFHMVFATAALAGRTVRRAWLDFTAAAPAGTSDFADRFTVQVTDGQGAVLGAFSSDNLDAKHILVPAGSVNTAGDTELILRSARTDTADRPAWSPAGPDFTSTYREGLAVAGPLRLIVEVDLEYHS